MAAVIEEAAPPEADIPVATDVTFRGSPLSPRARLRAHAGRTYTVALFPTDRVLTALEKIKGELDGTLSFRRSCGHGDLRLGRDAQLTAATGSRARRWSRDLDTDKPHHHRSPSRALTSKRSPDRRHGAVLRGLPPGASLPHPRRPRAESWNACSRPRGQSPLRRHHQVHPVCCVQHDLVPGLLDTMISTSGRRRSSRRTASSSTVGDSGFEQRLEVLNDKEGGVGAVAPPSTAPMRCPRGIEVTRSNSGSQAGR